MLNGLVEMGAGNVSAASMVTIITASNSFQTKDKMFHWGIGRGGPETLAI